MRERERECVCVCVSLYVCMRASERESVCVCEREREGGREKICFHKYPINDVLNNFRECYGVSCGLTAPTA